MTAPRPAVPAPHTRWATWRRRPALGAPSQRWARPLAPSPEPPPASAWATSERATRRHAPRLGRRIPSPARRQARPRRVGRALAPRRLEHDAVTAFEGLATDRAQAILAALDATRQAGTAPRLGVRIPRRASHLRHGQATRPRADACLEPWATLSDPSVARDLGTAPAQRRLPAPGNALCAVTTRETAVRA